MLFGVISFNTGHERIIGRVVVMDISLFSFLSGSCRCQELAGYEDVSRSWMP